MEVDWTSVINGFTDNLFKNLPAIIISFATFLVVLYRAWKADKDKKEVITKVGEAVDMGAANIKQSQSNAKGIQTAIGQNEQIINKVEQGK